MWTKIKLILSAIGAAVMAALSALCYVFYTQKQKEKARADRSEFIIKDLKNEVEVKNGFDTIQRKADELASARHSAVSDPNIPVSDVLQDLHNCSKNRVRSHKQ